MSKMRALWQASLTATKRALTWNIEDMIPPSERFIYNFNSKDEIKKWHLYSDSEYGGLSSASFEITDAVKEKRGTGVFSGNLSLDVTDGTKWNISRSGFCGMRSKKFDGFIDLDSYDTIALKIKGDGRSYISTIYTENWVNSPGQMEDNSWQAFVAVPRDNWVIAKIPLEHYLPTWRGNVIEADIEMNPQRVVGMSLSVNAEGGVPGAQTGPVQTCCLSSRLNFEKHVALFVFGDSLFDPGNNNYIDTITEYQANYWPYGISYFHPPSGRNNDGRVIPDFIAEYARLPLIPAYLNPQNNEFTHGANFASGGSGALIETKAGFVIDLHTQVRYFGELENRYRQNLGDNKARRLISNAVYLFSSGINDYLDLTDPDAYDQHVGIVIGNLTNAIKGIYEKGGRKFGFMTVPLIGCFPTMRVEQPGNTCSKEIDDIMRLHNQAFAKRLEILETQLEGFIYAKFDFATSFDKIMKNPSKYGFKEGATACCGSGPFRGEYSCGGMRGIKEYELCENATEYLFFDCGHPSELASRQLAELFWKGDSNVTGPYNLKTFFQGKGSRHASS